MRPIAAHGLAFLSTWAASVVGLVCVGIASEIRRDRYTANPVQEFIQVIALYGIYSGLCVGAAWILVAVPYYGVFLRGERPRSAKWHALVAGFLGFGFMVFATRFLPVADNSWHYAAPVGSVAASVGILVLIRARSRQGLDNA